ncbi:MAG: acyl-ACP--UDP-N-acetylglucosamine O-acyltransferase [Lentisphaerota bacterium]
MTDIHSTAIVDPGAELGDSVVVGPYCIVGPHVKLGEGTRLMSHVCVDGWTTMGRECTVFPFAHIGGQTQDLKFKGGAPRLEVGDRTTLRECVTLNTATNDGDVTRVGSGCHIMAYAHVAHDCVVGNHVIMANGVALAGHVTVEDDAIIGGLSGAHQFVRIGRMSIMGGCTKAVKDVPPFMMADGNPLEIHSPNTVGLERHGISEEVQRQLKEAYKMLYRQKLSTRQALEKIEAELAMSPEMLYLVNFIKGSERGITK